MVPPGAALVRVIRLEIVLALKGSFVHREEDSSAALDHEIKEIHFRQVCTGSNIDRFRAREVQYCLKGRLRLLGQKEVRDDAFIAISGSERDLLPLPVVGLLSRFNGCMEWRFVIRVQALVYAEYCFGHGLLAVEMAGLKHHGIAS